LSPEAWLARLAEAGFPHSTAWPQAQNSQLASANQHLLVAQKDTVHTAFVEQTVFPEATPATSERSSHDHQPAPVATRLAAEITQQFANVLKLDTSELTPHTHFMDLGFDSILALQLRTVLQQTLGIELESTVLFRYPSIAELSAYLATQTLPASFLSLASTIVPTIATQPIPSGPPSPQPARTPQFAHSAALSLPSRATDVDAIAVIGLACRMAGATTPEQLWENLCAGVDATSEVPASRWDWRSHQNLSAKSNSQSCHIGGFLDQVAEFDPGFFHISPREARFMDPQQRLFLEVVWECLERAGYRSDRLGRRCGLFVGVSASDYTGLLAHSGAHLDPHCQSGNATSLIATRVAYLLDLRGPAVSIDTACSSSLVAVHLACQSLRTGESDVAIAGGVNLILDPAGMIMVNQFGMLAADGHCKAFDDRADGFVRGEGVGAVLLKPLAAALRDGDQVLAVIRATTINNDGHSKAGLAAPNPKAQQEVIADAYERAAIPVETIGYIEAHGTGTALGDPIELDGLASAFRQGTNRQGYCAIASVKTNLGHLEAAAGIAGLIKAVLVVQQGKLPPTLHLESPNRHINFERSPFYVNDRLRSWNEQRSPRRAGVSSFGFGGTNAHVILEQAPTEARKASSPLTAGLVLLSAQNQGALADLVGRLADHMEHNPSVHLADLCYTLNVGRAAHSQRIALIARQSDQLLDRLQLARLAGFSRSLPGIVIASDARLTPAELSHRLELLQPVVAQIPIQARLLILTACTGPATRALFERAASLHDQLLSPTAASDLQQDSEVWLWLLNLVAQLWTLGDDVDWVALDPAPRRRLCLPTYPFQRQRYWVDSAPAPIETSLVTANDQSPAVESPSNVSQWLFERTWNEAPIARDATPRPAGRCLILHDGSSLSAALLAQLRQSEANVVEVVRGSKFEMRSSSQFVIDAERPQDFTRLVRSLSKQKWHPNSILHLWCSGSHVEPPNSLFDLEDRLAEGPVSLILLMRALMRARQHQPLRLLLASTGSQPVDAHDVVHRPEAAALARCGLGLAAELPWLSAQYVDLPQDQSACHIWAHRILEELQLHAPHIEVAYRGDRRLVPSLVRTPISTNPIGPIRAGGTYLITGGLGGIGLEFAHWLVKQGATNLVLVSRAGLPAREEWKTYEVKTPGELVTRRIQAVQQLERLGAEVWCPRLNVAELEEVQELVAEIRQRFGPLHGVIHAAGISVNRPLERLTLDKFKGVLEPKVFGAWALDQATGQESLDFTWYCSSWAAIVPGPRQADYAAANSFLDAMATWRSSQGFPTLSINWGMWGQVGMAVDYVDAVRATGLMEPMSPQEALRAFSMTSKGKSQQIIVAPGPKWEAAYLQTPSASAADPAHQPATGDIGVDEIEAYLVSRLAHLLELDPQQLDRQEAFPDLGLDSILVVQLTREIESKLQASLPYSVLRDHPNISSLAQYLSERWATRQITKS
jgi:polyketide synthase PksN